MKPKFDHETINKRVKNLNPEHDIINKCVHNVTRITRLINMFCMLL